MSCSRLSHIWSVKCANSLLTGWAGHRPIRAGGFVLADGGGGAGRELSGGAVAKSVEGKGGRKPCKE